MVRLIVEFSGGFVMDTAVYLGGDLNYHLAYYKAFSESWVSFYFCFF